MMKAALPPPDDRGIGIDGSETGSSSYDGRMGGRTAAARRRSRGGRLGAGLGTVGGRLARLGGLRAGLHWRGRNGLPGARSGDWNGTATGWRARRGNGPVSYTHLTLPTNREV